MNGIQEVVGSIPISSTRKIQHAKVMKNVIARSPESFRDDEAILKGKIATPSAHNDELRGSA